jgi:hypothetical protein
MAGKEQAAGNVEAGVAAPRSLNDRLDLGVVERGGGAADGEDLEPADMAGGRREAARRISAARRSLE